MRILKFRIDEHKGYIVNKKLENATGAHFNLPGHTVSNLTVTVLEIPTKNYVWYRKERERYHIRRFGAYHNGMNKQE